MDTVLIVLLVLVVLAVLGGFALKWLFIVAVVLLLLAGVRHLTGSDRRNRL